MIQKKYNKNIMKPLLLLVLIFVMFNVNAQQFIQVTSQNNSENYPINSEQLITWNSENVDNVKIEYTTMYNIDYETPTDWIEITANTASDGSYNWTIPSEVIALARIKISEVGNSGNYDICDLDFSSYDPATNPKNLKLVTPNGGETIQGTSTYFNISWVQENVTMEVILEYSTDNGNSWNIIDEIIYNGTNYSNIYGYYKSVNWIVPDLSSNQCLIRIKDKNDYTIFDITDATFTIENPVSEFIEVTSQNSGNTYEINTEQQITWNAGGVSDVKIEYTTNFNNFYNNPNDWITITNSTQNNGSYNWLLPNEVISACRIRISEVGNSTNYDICDMDFTTFDPAITPKNIRIVTPNGGEVLDTISSYFNISWVQQNVMLEVILEYSIDNGSSWNTIENFYRNGYQYSNAYGMWKSVNWIVPDEISSNCKIRIKDKNDYSIYDITDANFSLNSPVSEYIEVTSQNEGNAYEINSSQLITWNAVGVSDVKIEYTASFNNDYNNPNDWITIENSTPNDGSYNWTLPSDLIYAGRIKITKIGNSTNYDICDLDFTTYDPSLTPKNLQLTIPNGNEVLIGNSVYNNISWKYQNVFTEIVLEYSTNNGSSWSEIENIYYGQNQMNSPFGAFRCVNWKVPNVSSTQCLIRIKDKGNSDIYDISDNTFTINEGTENIDNIDNKILCQVFPNPTNGIFQIDFLENEQKLKLITLRDITGKLIYLNETVNKSEIIDISNNKSGIYIIQVKYDNVIQNIKIIKK